MASLFFYYSTMNAGKSADLIRNNYNYIERGMRSLVLKPAIDTREGESVIKSRTGAAIPCELFDVHANLFEWISSKYNDKGDLVDIVLIDEGQFMTKEQVKQLADVVDQLGVPVVVYGLRSDFQGNLFPGSAALFAIANKLNEIKTICWCGKAATMVLRLDDAGKVVKEGNQVLIGGNESYVSVCRSHFSLGKVAK